MENLQWLNVDRLNTYSQTNSKSRNLLFWPQALSLRKNQSVLAPDGMIISLMGSFEGRRHDARILHESNLYEQLQRCASFPDGHKFVIYGGQAYGIQELLLCPFRNRNLTPQMQAFNSSMKPLRQAVAWGFGKAVNEFAF
nr:unnamed protein product [Callosobruchus analis]